MQIYSLSNTKLMTYNLWDSFDISDKVSFVKLIDTIYQSNHDQHSLRGNKNDWNLFLTTVTEQWSVEVSFIAVITQRSSLKIKLSFVKFVVDL